MSRRFWNIFRDLAFLRISWSIQNKFISSYENLSRSVKKELDKKILKNNINDIKDKVYNNNFTKKRLKK
jgi:hypothetical protein